MSKQSVQTYYETLEPKYERYHGIPCLCEPGEHGEVVSMVRPYLPKNARVLDVGCGRGALGLRLHHAGYQVVGCDIFDLCECKDQIEFVHTTAEEAKFEGQFDAVFMVAFLVAVEAPYAIVRQYAPYIKPGGHLIISTVNVNSDTSRTELLLRGHLPYFEPHNVVNDGAFNPLFDFQIRYILGEVGLEVLERKTVLPHPQPPPGFGWGIRRILETYRRVGSRPSEPEDGKIALYVARKN